MMPDRDALAAAVHKHLCVTPNEPTHEPDEIDFDEADKILEILAHLEPLGDQHSKIVADLRWLAEARKEYCQGCPKSQGDLHDMGPMAQAVHDDHDAAERLADILEGKNEAKGWLPSWRWDEWEARRS